jgi:hypothetical protein
MEDGTQPWTALMAGHTAKDLTERAPRALLGIRYVDGLVARRP